MVNKKCVDESSAKTISCMKLYEYVNVIIQRFNYKRLDRVNHKDMQSSLTGMSIALSRLNCIE